MGGLNVPDDFNPRCVGRCSRRPGRAGEPVATPSRTGDLLDAGCSIGWWMFDAAGAGPSHPAAHSAAGPGITVDSDGAGAGVVIAAPSMSPPQQPLSQPPPSHEEQLPQEPQPPQSPIIGP
jgi:hypothetical protein